MTGRKTRTATKVGLAGPKAEKTIALALQGGGAHGAFTWGVLDQLIEDGRLGFEAISGASAGAMNAVAMTDGWQEGGPEGARAKLETFWREVSYDGKLNECERTAFDALLDFWAPLTSSAAFGYWRGTLSPSQANPLDLNPLRDALTRLLDFERIRAAPIHLFVATTRVWTGKIRVFETQELTETHILASACLPTIFRAVEIDGEPYWDGGYTGNPPLWPLYYGIDTDDLLLVQINPVERHETPTSVTAIQDRLNEITFNAGLLGELRVLDFVTQLVDDGKLDRASYKRVNFHRIDGRDQTLKFAASSRMKADWDLFRELRDIGRSRAEEWLKENYDGIGERSTLDLRSAYA